jgi:hypothetical protein
VFAGPIPRLARCSALATAVVAGLLASSSAFAAEPPTALSARAGAPQFLLAARAGKTAGQKTYGPHNSCCTPPLLNNKGPVESPARVFLDFWGPQWAAGWPDVAANAMAGGYYNESVTAGPTTYPNASATIQTYVTGFFQAVAKGTKPGWNNTQAQYGSKVPPVYGGSYVDGSSTPPTPVVTDNCAGILCLTDQPPSPDYEVETALNQLGSEALAAEAHFGYAPGADYMIFLPKGSSPVGFGYYCAYHDEIYDAQGRRISYSVIPYLPDANYACGENYVNTTNDAYGHGWLDGYSIVAGHEFAEAETDPFPFTAPAWQTSDGYETGDLCAWGSVTTYPAGNVRSGTGYWAVQSLWSNSARACVMG